MGQQLRRHEPCVMREGARVFCASTALIEAGINVSFPVVVRSLAGIPSIVQAAGRANRGLEYKTGTVHIWRLCDENLTNLEDIQCGANMTRSILEEIPASELDTRKVLDGYFAKEADAIRDRTDYPLKNRNHDTLYGLLAEKSSRVKSAGNFRSTQKLMLRQGFATAYHAFRAIPEETVAVLVPYGEGAQLIDRLRGAKTMAELTWLLRQAQNDCASLYASDFDRLQRAGAIDELGETGLYVLAPGFYDAAGGVGIHG